MIESDEYIPQPQLDTYCDELLLWIPSQKAIYSKQRLKRLLRLKILKTYENHSDTVAWFLQITNRD